MDEKIEGTKTQKVMPEEEEMKKGPQQTPLSPTFSDYDERSTALSFSPDMNEKLKEPEIFARNHEGKGFMLKENDQTFALPSEKEILQMFGHRYEPDNE